ncbi:MAG: APC family permease [Cryobacterium sp.]|uniref:APC family permease n=1 Tax=unclassified Cryobacterium TaxID=2649013 RepID=UPI0018C95831|nr:MULTISPECIES: APC family permease [unclassified Cryobacterium]MCY7403574.1 APC family permease [Cryobacterium sp.]MEC5154275.1 amino acid transporter [Cryobacterium sp. CAN_C3]
MTIGYRVSATTGPANPESTEISGIEQFGYTQELKRTLKFSDLMIYGLIFMVPIAPFAIFGGVFHDSGGMAPLAYIIALLAMMFSANSYSQMAQAFPMAGSVYTYAGRGIARPVGFIAGWMILLDYVLIPTLLYLAAAIAMNGIIPQVPLWAWLVAFIVLNTVINYLGMQLTARVNKVMLVLELVVLAIFLVVGIAALAQGKGQGFSFDAFFNTDTFSLPLLFGAASIAVLSFLGFDGISTLAEENAGPSKSIGRSMIAALIVVGVLFVVQTWVASMLVEDPAALLKNGDPTGVAFYRAAETAGGTVMFILTAASTALAWGFANALVAQAATSRLLYAMARDRQLPKFLSKVSARHSVPVNATILVAAISLILGLYLTVLPDGLGAIAALVNFGALTAFLLLNVSVVWWFVVKQKSRRWFVHLIFPVVGFAILVGVLYNARASAQVLGIVWLVIGIIVAIGVYRTGRMKTPLPPELPASMEARRP